MIAVFLSALVPLIVGFIYYNPKVLGNAWMKACGFTEENLKGANMPLIFGLTLVFSVMLAMMLWPIVVHQMGIMSLMAEKTITPETKKMGEDFSAATKDFFRTFKHGALHGFLASLFLALPIVGINALFERRGAKYIFIHFGYWAICMLLMGGIICQWSTM